MNIKFPGAPLLRVYKSCQASWKQGNSNGNLRALFRLWWGTHYHSRDGRKNPVYYSQLVYMPANYRPMRQGLISVFHHLLSQVPILCLAHKNVCCTNDRKWWTPSVWPDTHLGREESIYLFIQHKYLFSTFSVTGTTLDTIGNEIRHCLCGVYVLAGIKGKISMLSPKTT